MAAGNVRSGLRFTALIGEIFVYVGTAHAQERSSPGRGDFGVPLQPFLAGQPAGGSPRAEPMRVAYYAPRAQPAPVPRAKAVEEDNDETEKANEAPVIQSNRPTVEGSRAVLRDGIAYAPSEAPDNIKNAIWAVNSLRRKPYVWGGGHGSFNDYGYDCSGTVSFALHYAGLLDAPLPSSDLRHYGQRGRGRWITVYSRDGHTFAIIAGLRLDTTDMRDGDAVGPRWYVEGRDTHGFVGRHPAGW
jgi:cell wall-associated NlpC family hydrolase